MHVERPFKGLAVACCLLLFGSFGCKESGVLQRLGPTEMETLEVGRQVREILQAGLRHEFSVGLAPGCTVHVGVAARGDNHPDVRVEAVARNRVVSEISAPSLAPGVWVDLTLTVPASGADTVRLVAADDPIGVAWSRPLTVCAHWQQRAKPNVILISLDTLRADRLGAYGNPRGLTPNLDAIASRATLFDRAYSQYPNTLGSHATLFTGYYPCQHGVVGSAFNRIGRAERTLAKVFQENGYVTVAFTEDAYVGSGFGFDVGFDVYDNGATFDTGAFRGEAQMTFNHALSWLRRRPAAPFFLFLHTYAVHTPYTPSQSSLEFALEDEGRGYSGPFETSYDGLAGLAFNIGTLTLDSAALNRIERLYDGEVRDLDGLVGSLFDELKTLGLEKNTLVVLFSDHGEEFAEHGYLAHGETLHREALQVPLIFWKPGTAPAGRHVTPPIGLIDVGATIMGLVGIEGAFPGWPGRDRSSIIYGDSKIPDLPPVYSELHQRRASCGNSRSGSFAVCPYGGIAIRTAEHTYIHSRDMQTNEKTGYLFDVRGDPAELRDIAVERPDLIERFASLAEAHESFCYESRIATGRTPFDSDTAQKLRALGYIGEFNGTNR